VATMPSASDSALPHKTTEPAATIQVAAGSSGIAPVTKTGLRQDAAQKTAGRGQGWPCRREGGRMPPKKKAALARDGSAAVKWRGQDSNLRPRGYEPRELPGCSTPRHVFS